MDFEYDIPIRNGKERFVVIPERDYKALREQLEDDADFRAIEASKRRGAGKPRISHEQMMRELGLTPGRGKRKG